MDERTVFDVDCSALIPKCGFACSRCIEEIEAKLTAVEGVSNAHIADEGGERRACEEGRFGAVR